MRAMVTGLLMGLMLFPVTARAADIRTAPTSKETTELVRQLGDDSYEVRDAAARKLAELGRSAETALRQGLNDDDAEVRRQCQTLLDRATRSDLAIALDNFLQDHDEKHVLKLPAWERFKKLAGDDPSAKGIFVEMCCSEAVLLEALEKNPKDASDKFTARCQQLQQQLYSPTGQRGTVSLGQVTALLFIATDSRMQLTLQAHSPMYNLMQQPGPREGIQNNGVARKLLVTYLEQRTEPNLMHQNLYLAINFNLKESVGWALKLAKAKETQAYVRATAITVVGRLGGKEHMTDLEAMLTDSTQIGASTFNTVKIQTEVRDVALAMLVQLSGQSLVDYNFPYIVQLNPQLRGNVNQNFTYAPSLLGFSDAAGREAAQKKWKDWVAAQKK